MGNKAKRSRKIKSPEELRQEAERKMRQSLVEAGIPEHRVEGAKVHDFRQETFADLKERRKVIRSLYSNVADRWLAEGGPGFDDPQRRAIEHCRGLWALIGERRLTANYSGVGGGGGDREGQVFALSQLAQYKKDIPTAYWSVFENIVRFDMPAGTAGAGFASNNPQQQAHAKSCVGFVASLIAQWRGY